MRSSLIDEYLLVVRNGYNWETTPLGRKVLVPCLPREQWMTGAVITSDIENVPVPQALFRDFARLHESAMSEETVLAFANRFGLLCGWIPPVTDQECGDTLEDWQRQSCAVWKAVRLYQALKCEGGIRLSEFLHWRTDGVGCFFGNPQKLAAYTLKYQEAQQRELARQQFLKDRDISDLLPNDRDYIKKISHFETGYLVDHIAHKSQTLGEQADWEELKEMRTCGKMLEANQLAAKIYLQRIINEQYSVYLTTKEAKEGNLVVRVVDAPIHPHILRGNDISFQMHLRPDNLRGLIWLQLTRWFTTGADYQECKNCRGWFLIGMGGRPRNALYCTSKCQQQAANRRNCPTTRSARAAGKKNNGNLPGRLGSKISE